ncbi:hypothetical protein LJC68_09995 [Bacteroidales bacterium OttesenSCG-928-B11]|nr:hypothetical protein [Bacteroidales bacterium OttesenSCG-928-E04]MDL2308871.1 hypothetical protein [Bacteroidales bacterium OttesenSCG-928-C03]MDL2313191.1 hypothetical protein [Bacteroidales bacterium OttesenSCG-928-B11]MDL2326914.1 hypothetical protein [Bacteroidales bacterium OttesenSCG-928-A14]
MSKTKFLSILFLLATANVVAQSEKFEYRFSIDVENTIEKDTVPWKYQIGANEYSFVGNYQKTRETWDKNGVGKPQITEEDSLYFIGFLPINAKDYIIERSKREQIIIINEAHTYPNHRTFTHSLLQGLYDNGYRYLGLEALFDTIINERKYPIIESGYYTREPEFGNLIYTALNIGFTLFGYDDFEHNGKEREIAQARNIANFMEQNPHGKVLIHCGHDHVIEGTPNNRTWEKAMAGRLKEYTRINPFTIDQTQFAEKSERKNNHPYIAMINKGFSVVLIDENGNLFNGKKGNDQVDVRIIHPETHYINNRPNFLLGAGNRKEYHIEKSTIPQYALLVLAYRKNEFENNGVPADIIEVFENENIPSLILDKGNYEIIMKDKNYNIINRYEIKIE